MKDIDKSVQLKNIKIYPRGRGGQCPVCGGFNYLVSDRCWDCDQKLSGEQSQK